MTRWDVIDNRGNIIYNRIGGRRNAEATAEDLDWDQPELAPHTTQETT